MILVFITSFIIIIIIILFNNKDSYKVRGRKYHYHIVIVEYIISEMSARI